jgi:hypothetical protein
MNDTDYSGIHKHEFGGLGPFSRWFFSQKHATVITGCINSNSPQLWNTISLLFTQNEVEIDKIVYAARSKSPVHEQLMKGCLLLTVDDSDIFLPLSPSRSLSNTRNTSIYEVPCYRPQNTSIGIWNNTWKWSKLRINNFAVPFEAAITCTLQCIDSTHRCTYGQLFFTFPQQNEEEYHS